jgi:polyhydroxyalkanoate synthesis regulator phasin
LKKEKAMATKKTSSPRRPARARAKANSPATTTRDRIRQTWGATVEALTSAEAQAERRLRRLVARNRVTPAEARAILDSFRTRVQKGRRRAARQLGARLSALQVRLRHDGKNLGRMVDQAVRGTLAALDIPTRHEVSQLTRKVDELSRKLDGFRRQAPRARRTAAPASA